MREPVPYAPFRLIEGEIHLWRIMLDQPGETLRRLRSLLSPDEGQRAERFRFERDRDHYTVGRAALRQILGGYLGVAPGSLEFLYGEYGKPSLAERSFGDEGRPLYFNLAHSHRLALCGVTRSEEIGVDVERIVAMEDALQIAASFFSPREQEILRSLPVDRIDEGFFNCWTRKEAFVKLKGEGLSHRLDTFDVSLAPEEPAAILSLSGSREAAASWKLYSLIPEQGYVAAVAIAKGEWEVRELEWRFDLV